MTERERGGRSYFSRRTGQIKSHFLLLKSGLFIILSKKVGDRKYGRGTHVKGIYKSVPALYVCLELLVNTLLTDLL